VRCSALAAFAATSSSSVDLPTPGSPASSATAPGTRPPPSTRSNSSMLVGRDAATRASTCPIGRAAALTGPAAVVRTGTAPTSSMVPQALHSVHRPVHLGGVYPHSVQRYEERTLDAVERAAMP
jgi:hypothetical protein